MKDEDRFMDFKTDLLINIPKFFEEIDNNESYQNEASFNALKRIPPRKFKKSPAQSQLFCRMCWLAQMPKEIYTSHNIGEEKCPQLSYQDKIKLKNAFKLNMINDSQEQHDSDENDIAANFGYQDVVEEEVNLATNCDNHKVLHRNNMPLCSFIKPISSQILTVFKEKNNKTPIHIELDSGASINFCEENIVLKLGLNIKYNKQVVGRW